jgi:ribose transport system substrate-binding protein
VARGSSRKRRGTLLGVAAALVMALPSTALAQGEGNPYFEQGAIPGSGEGVRIGYISLGDSLPFVKLVSDSIAEQAEIAGAELIFCDSRVTDSEALSCAQQMAVQGADVVLNFQAFAQISNEICAAYDNLPTIAIDIHQEPCEVAFMGADNAFAGFVVGEAVGQAMEAETGCAFDLLVTLESPQVGEVNTQRTQGMLDGFTSVCGEIPDGSYQSLGVGGTTDLALEQVTNLLPTVPMGGILVVLSLNDDMALGALAAARTAGREGELRIGAQGADPSAWEEIACNPNWLADAAYFPERYGRTLVPAAIDIHNGVEVPRELFTPHVAVTVDNILELYPEVPACG